MCWHFLKCIYHYRRSYRWTDMIWIKLADYVYSVHCILFIEVLLQSLFVIISLSSMKIARMIYLIIIIWNVLHLLLTKLCNMGPSHSMLARFSWLESSYSPRTRFNIVGGDCNPLFATCHFVHIGGGQEPHLCLCPFWLFCNGHEWAWAKMAKWSKNFPNCLLISYYIN